MKGAAAAAAVSASNTTWRIFTYKELHVATNGFSEDNKLGEGGFGSVYWGKTNDGLQIAVKKLKAMNSKAEMEFAVEVEVLGRVRHKNLLGLRGYCAGTDQRLIVYDYMPNLSLLSHLHGQFAGEVQLDWKRRMKVAIGSGEGLLYLHHEATPHIIHRDIKASNVLLDSNFDPLVADFGFAKLIPDGVSHMTTRVKGTLGYLAPEYAMWGKVSESCDVYSFGILLLELVTGRKPIEKLPGGIKRTITEWAEPFIVQGKFRDLVDPKLRGNFDENQTEEVLEWDTRYRIALGVARGLHYLHKCCKHRIIHRDIKASNVLLGPDYEPQITDFGLAKWLPNKWTHHAVIPIEGTFGYLAPEYFMHGIVDEKTDVYSFGVLLLEIISGRRPVDSSMQNLLLWAKPLMESGNVAELADPKLEGKYEADQMYRVVLTASYCVRQSAAWRPSMSEVLELLTTGQQDSEVAKSWRIPKFTSDELDDFSMVYGYDVPLEIDLEKYL
ncbi:unnamed protein product [Linum tenue]|uniref:Protein kinase domain-containing protein n=1 Tax=Linum tenue TaxID=586396 RepID=A0AAV0IZK3_9ROSI|nr:unnamed protein product [Linum tenue]